MAFVLPSALSASSSRRQRRRTRYDNLQDILPLEESGVTLSAWTSKIKSKYSHIRIRKMDRVVAVRIHYESVLGINETCSTVALDNGA